MKLIEIILAGWYVFGPILVCSVYALAVIAERFIYLGRAARQTRAASALKGEALAELAAGQPDKARETCGKMRGPLAHLFAAGITRAGEGPGKVREAMEAASLRVIPGIEKFLPTLSTVANVATLLGLMGTVTGMIKAFNRMGQSASANAPQLALYIGEALLSTAAGLAVAIPVLLAANFLTNRAAAIISELEVSSSEFLDALPGGGGSKPLGSYFEEGNRT